MALVRSEQATHFVLYGFGLIPWTKKEIAQFDVKTGKLLTASNSHHPQSAVERLYLPRSAGGIGLINVENLFYRRMVSTSLLLLIVWWVCV